MPKDTLKKVLKKEVNEPEVPEVIEPEISNEPVEVPAPTAASMLNTLAKPAPKKSFEEALKDSQNNMFRKGN